ncbi:hypothetical protein AAEO50_06360 [Rossellomorea oryzaecorticis]|uniref:Uncharacterized protein n=1 Tax=Rossellomorea oryzaecorticis TaxID=1396505 RepID=A0ABU9K785_9BACI
MIYIIIGIIIALIVLMKVKTSRKVQKVDNRYEIYTYVVMEKEDEEKFNEADQKLWELTETYPFLYPGQILCKEDRDHSIFQDEWDEVRKYSSYTKDKEPYYIFFDEYRADPKRHTRMPWDQKVLETNDIEKVKQWCGEFEDELFEKHGEYVGKVSEY